MTCKATLLSFGLVLCLSACGLTRGDDPRAVEQDFGVSVRTMIENQTVTPPPGETRTGNDEMTAGDGEAGVDAIRRLRGNAQ